MTSTSHLTSFSGPDLCQLYAHEVVELLKAGEVSSYDLLEAAFKRIEFTAPMINATPTLCQERAYSAAKNSGKFRNDDPGWLGGLPISIKDLTPVEGVRTTFGTKGLANFIPVESDPLVERLEARAGIVIGKTNTPEFGAGGNTFNEVFGPTLNPWNTALNAGGSSGGAAASLAAGETWLSHGSDHGGSLRTPAAYCGIVGLRPSPGRVGGGSKDAKYFLEGVQGPMARCVRDCALFLDAMVGMDPQSPLSFPAPASPFQEAVLRADGKLKIAFTANLNGFSPVEPEIEQHLRGVMNLLENNGARVEETCPKLPKLEETYHTLRGMMWATLARRVGADIRKHFKPTLEQNTRMGEALVISDICDANLDRSVLYNNMVNFLDQYDVLACPTVGCMAHPVSEEWVREIDGQKFTNYMDWLRFAYLSTVTGLPSLSVPAGLGPNGLPIGLQLIGKPRGEAELLAAARAVEVAVGGPLGPIDPCVAGSGQAGNPRLGQE